MSNETRDSDDALIAWFLGEDAPVSVQATHNLVVPSELRELRHAIHHIKRSGVNFAICGTYIPRSVIVMTTNNLDSFSSVGIDVCNNCLDLREEERCSDPH